jgi:hypothetical protein
MGHSLTSLRPQFGVQLFFAAKHLLFAANLAQAEHFHPLSGLRWLDRLP